MKGRSRHLVRHRGAITQGNDSCGSSQDGRKKKKKQKPKNKGEGRRKFSEKRVGQGGSKVTKGNLRKKVTNADHEKSRERYIPNVLEHSQGELCT